MFKDKLRPVMRTRSGRTNVYRCRFNRSGARLSLFSWVSPVCLIMGAALYTGLGAPKASTTTETVVRPDRWHQNRVASITLMIRTCLIG